MQLSMLLIAERLEMEGCKRLVHNRWRSTYSEVMFYGDNIIPEPEILYLSDGIPSNLPDKCSDFGLVIKLSPQDFQKYSNDCQALPCDCLALCTDMALPNVFNEITALFIHLRKQIDDFKTAAYTQKSLQKLIEMLHGILGNPAYLVDSSFKVLAIDRSHDMRDLSATWRRLEDEGYLPFDLVSNLINSGELSLMEADRSATYVDSRYFYTSFINYNLRHQGKVQGHLFIAGTKRRIKQSEVELTSHLGEYVLHAMMNNPRFQNERGNYYEYFMCDLFSGKLENPLHIRQQMLFLGHHPDDYYTVAALHPSPDHGLSNERIANQLERCSGAKPVLYNGKIVTLFSHGKTPDRPSLHKKLNRIRKELNCEIGVSDVFRGFYEVSTYCTQAEWALTSHSPEKREGVGRQAEQLNSQEIRHYNDCVMQHVIYQFQKNVPQWKTLVIPELLYLHAYEEKAGIDLVNTLFVYLQRERSVLETSEHLHIHRNTLAYRIKKIIDLCDFDLDDPAVRRRLLLSLEVLKMVEAEQEKKIMSP